MTTLNFALLGKIEEQALGADGLEGFLKETKERNQKIQEVQKIVQKLQGNKIFSEVLTITQEIESLDVKMIKAKEIMMVNKLVSDMENNERTNEMEAYKNMRELNKIVFSIPWIEEICKAKLIRCKEILLPKFHEYLVEHIKNIAWPFMNKGNLLALNYEQIEKFKELFIALVDIESLEYPTQIMADLLADQISYHFVSENKTSKIEKPEWMLDFALKSLRLNICQFMDDAEIPHNMLEKILQISIRSMLSIISKRIHHDADKAIEIKKETLFLHIIDETLKFDSSLSEFKSKESLLDSFMNEKLIDLWISYEKVYISDEIKKTLSKESWDVDKIEGMIFANIKSIILLHTSLAMKYSVIKSGYIKKQLAESKNNVIINTTIEEYQTQLSEIESQLMIHVSGESHWNVIVKRASALYHSLVLFQKFLVDIDKSLFAEEHMKLNQLKKDIINYSVELLMVTVKEIVKNYLSKSGWNDRESLNNKSIKRCVKDFKVLWLSEVVKTILGFVSQKITGIVCEYVGKKKIDQAKLENLYSDFKVCYKILEDDTDQYAVLVDRISKRI